MLPRSLPRRIALLLVVAIAAVGCSDETAADSCTETREPLDPLSIQHVIDAQAAIFLTDPPTSGPHIAGPAVAGLLDTALTSAAQVRVLEAGGVVVQYRSPITEADIEPLLDANDGLLVIAPNDTLPAPVVATAWTWKLTCGSAGLDEIRSFATARATDAPGED